MTVLDLLYVLLSIKGYTVQYFLLRQKKMSKNLISLFSLYVSTYDNDR